jgi:hypothetical protein
MSEIRATTISDAAGTGPITLTGQSAAKAWWYSDIDAVLQNSFNISSSTDVSTGRHQVDFTNSMSSFNYSATTSTRTATAACYVTTVFTLNSNYTVVQVYRSTTEAFTDRPVAGSIAGDLA